MEQPAEIEKALSKISYNHLSQKEAALLKTAVTATENLVNDIKAGNPRGMIITASDTGHLNETGYGCGKTTLARSAYTAFRRVNSSGESSYVIKRGLFFTSRTAMQLFDSDEDDLKLRLRNIRPLLVIDDVGREGTLRWEKRDEVQQLREKQNRYYYLINLCYVNKIGLFITTNLTSLELAKFLGGASWSRLLEIVPRDYRINLSGVRDMRPLLGNSE